MENNDYYEPTIKINGINEPKVEINFDNYIEKQQLISWLEDKIKELEEKIKNLNYNEIEYYDEVKIDIYQEVLDFVTKGGKE